MSENTHCLIGCITSDDDGRGYYCEEVSRVAIRSRRNRQNEDRPWTYQW